MNIQLSDHFNYKKLLRFTFPSIIMLVFTSIYGVVDGPHRQNSGGGKRGEGKQPVFPDHLHLHCQRCLSGGFRNLLCPSHCGGTGGRGTAPGGQCDLRADDPCGASGIYFAV